ncbi:zinc-dependent alcohol dehydrogenase family protein [Caulobacter sp. 602-1]|uniref:zinc-dependent alcohol dehydrogenase family protein n=1 Tax=Caulobacter sp. 602-1 TaxID=2492472 RepID=UPI000F63D715|nr:zinc-dependent alcohol dehydrogenase family protein [Caulobacter sp. 602-1]RRN63506.1 quinone oxidoreductase [Caulobacter sp. 602-1]
MSATMKVLVLEEAQGAFRLLETQRPTPGPGEVLVHVVASGVNPLDLKIRAGEAAHARHAAPAVLGLDLSGVVEAVGDDVLDFEPGDRVFGMTGGVGGVQGSLATHAVVDQRLLALAPDGLDLREAAALPLISITAWEGLVDRAGVRSGQRVLVLGGAGGVGHVAIQIARSFGARVWAVDAPEKAPVIESLGATAISRDQTVDDYLAAHTDGEGFDLVYDTVGGPVLDQAFKSVRRFGHVVSCLGWGTHALAPLSFKAATYSGVFTLLPLLTGVGRERHGEILREVARLADLKLLKPIVDPTRFSLAEADAAHQWLAERRASGKVVVEIQA